MKKPYNKVVSMEEAMGHFFDGMTIMFGGFGGVGSPPGLITSILEKGIKNITLIGNDTGFPDIGIGQLIKHKRVKKVIASHIGSNPIAGELMSSGQMEVEFSPQGILAERMRAGGVGLEGIITEIGADNEYLAEGKETITIGPKKCVIETALTAKVSILYAKKADEFGNLIYDKSARNTNPIVAMAGEWTIVEAEEIVPFGSICAEEIITPGVFVDMVVPSKGVNWTWAWEKQ
ncbi:CoA transferase subunit A [Falsibacillus pallidus]|uniref:6-acetamido-3-oxohexanoate:acetyl-CoA CoA transferase alpha subunit n=1 Tax=Falsibacillus pallidus TaxID=493781 RepID=A0A370GIQ5_9BACI|nr:CoA transferase subunit A [Falsibacillus pallidus]RDI43089.1 6-acetamido-3-oxohexanoate:acetyl-CoA CoA transferase alpha subunit [Falsibacillus pallidus]